MINKLTESALGIALLTGLIYALSIANHNGYLSVIGVEEGFINRSSYQILYNALFVILVPSIEAAFWLFLILAGITVVISFFETFLLSSFASKRRLVRFKDKIKKKFKLSTLERILLRIYKHYFYAFVALAIVLISLVYAENQGKEKGLQLVSDVNEGKTDSYSTVNIQGYMEPLVIISCGVNNCAGLDLKTKTIHYFEKKFYAGNVSNPLKLND